MTSLARLGWGTAALVMWGCTQSSPPPPLPVPELQTSTTESLLQAVSVVDSLVVWVSGHEGVLLRTRDGGATWGAVQTPAGDSLQYRDVRGFSETHAVILSAGTGPASRIYRTTDAGATWHLSYLMEHPAGFLDCLDFWDERGFAYGDAVDGAPFVLVTHDGGSSWARADASSLPPALEGEGGFAASGTCARAGSDGRGWIATGASGAARVLRTGDYGASWQAVDVPVVRGDAAGLTTVSFREDDRLGVALGGDLANMDGRTDNAVRTEDGGATWQPAAPPSFVGPVYGSVIVPGSSITVAVGPAGASYTRDGLSWIAVDSVAYWAVGASVGGSTWMVGPGGRVVKLRLR